MTTSMHTTSAPTQPVLLDLESRPAWDYRVVARGVEMAFLHPDQQAEASMVRKPGAAVRLWRWAFGDPGLDESSSMLSMCLALFARELHPHLRSLSSGEHYSIIVAYQQALTAWTNAMQAAYLKAHAAANPAPTPQTRPAASHGAGAVRSYDGMQRTTPVKVMPGGPVPQIFLVGCENPEAARGGEGMTGRRPVPPATERRSDEVEEQAGMKIGFNTESTEKKAWVEEATQTDLRMYEAGSGT